MTGGPGLLIFTLQPLMQPHGICGRESTRQTGWIITLPIAALTRAGRLAALAPPAWAVAEWRLERPAQTLAADGARLLDLTRAAWALAWAPARLAVDLA